MAMLEVEGLTKRFGGLTANNDISFNVDEGTILGVSAFRGKTPA
jgi:branched-chain amino acid transport system ATP-binding protein